MQRPETEAIRTQIQPSKPKRGITKNTNSQNTKRTYCHPSKQLFPKRWPLSNPNRSNYNMNTCKVKRQQNSDSKNRQQRTATEYRLVMVSNELRVGGGLNMSYNSMIFFIFLSKGSNPDQNRMTLRANICVIETQLKLIHAQAGCCVTQASSSNFEWPFLCES